MEYHQVHQYQGELSLYLMNLTMLVIQNLSNNSYLTVQGLDLRGANNGFKVAGSQNEHHITISNCYFNNLSDGIFAYPNVPYLSITNCNLSL